MFIGLNTKLKKFKKDGIIFIPEKGRLKFSKMLNNGYVGAIFNNGNGDQTVCIGYENFNHLMKSGNINEGEYLRDVVPINNKTNEQLCFIAIDTPEYIQLLENTSTEKVKMKPGGIYRTKISHGNTFLEQEYLYIGVIYKTVVFTNLISTELLYAFQDINTNEFHLYPSLKNIVPFVVISEQMIDIESFIFPIAITEFSPNNHHKELFSTKDLENTKDTLLIAKDLLEKQHSQIKEFLEKKNH